jgi:hypothetical protein
MKYYDSMGFESPDGIWARRADVVDIEYSIKLQRLIENLKYDTETPYPELHHHKMIVAAKARIRELEAALHQITATTYGSELSMSQEEHNEYFSRFYRQYRDIASSALAGSTVDRTGEP